MSSDLLSPDEARAAREAIARLDVGRPLPAPDDGEVAALWRQTKALAESGLFAGSQKGTNLTAGEAFAKALAGRELGLGPFEAMQQLHVMPDGKLEASSDLHATRVREREGFDFEVFWIKSTTGAAHFDTSTKANLPVPDGEREAVPAKADDPTDLRTVVGCAIAFSVDGEPRGVARWTIEDSLRANLTRDRGHAKSLHVSYPQSMYYARAMTNGVAWYVPEVMGGLRVYGLGEVSRDAPQNLTAGEGVGHEAATADLPTEVEALIARARELGHEGLQSRETALMAVQGGEDTLRRWVRGATATLNRLAAAREAEVAPEDVSSPVPDETAPTPDPAPEAESAPQAPQDDARGTESQDDVRAGALAAMRERLAEAERAAEDADLDGDDGRAAEFKAEAEALRDSIAAMQDPEQTTLGGL